MGFYPGAKEQAAPAGADQVAPSLSGGKIAEEDLENLGASPIGFFSLDEVKLELYEGDEGTAAEEAAPPSGFEWGGTF